MPAATTSKYQIPSIVVSIVYLTRYHEYWTTCLAYNSMTTADRFSLKATFQGNIIIMQWI